MEANELRIGNYVMFNQEQFTNNKNHQEVELTCNDGVVLKTFSYPYRDIQPIPLTEEWLIKFGFELDGQQVNGNYYKLQFNYSSGYRDFISISDKGAGYMFNITSNYDRSAVLPFNYEYVHQLQNLYFALCGTELKLNN